MAKQNRVMKSKLDIYDRLNSTTSVIQLRNARGVVERLRDDRWQYFDEGSTRLTDGKKDVKNCTVSSI